MPIWVLATVLCVPLYIEMISLRQYSDSQRGIAFFLEAFGTGMLAVAFAERLEQIPFIISALAFTQAAYTLVYQWQGVNLMQSGDVLRAGGTFAQPNYLSTFLLITIPFAFQGAAQTSSRRIQFAYAAMAVVQFASLVLTGSRGAVVALAISLPVFCYITTRSIRMAGLTLLCLVVLTVGINARRSSGAANGQSVGYSNASRPFLWKAGWNTFVVHPVTGVGLGRFSILTREVRGPEKTLSVHGQEDPRNLYLHWLAELGLAGGFLLALMIWTVTSIIRHAKRQPDTAAFSAAWIGLLIMGLFDTPFGPPAKFVGNCAFGLLLGVTALTPIRSGEQRDYEVETSAIP